MTVILSSADTAAPKIGYKNLFDSALSVTASSEATGFEKENAYDWRLYDWWKPATTGTHYLTATFNSAVTADYFAVFGHDLHKHGASVKLQSSPDGATWTDRVGFQAPTTGRVIFVSFAAASAIQWRVVLETPSGPASIGMVAFGEALSFPYQMAPGFVPPPLSREHEIMNSQAETGAFIGRSIIRRAHPITIQRDMLEPDWIRTHWEPFMDHAEEKPFFFSWDSENHPTEAAFCWSEDRRSRVPYDSGLYMSVNMRVRALTEL